MLGKSGAGIILCHHGKGRGRKRVPQQEGNKENGSFQRFPGKENNLQSVSLHCLAGPLRGQTFRLDGGPVFIFGRYAKAHFSLAADPATSHLHFVVDISDDRVRILDLDSTNGIVINEKHHGGKQGPPMRRFQTLQSGDTVLAGSCLFRVAVAEAAPFKELASILDAAPAAGSAPGEKPGESGDAFEIAGGFGTGDNFNPDALPSIDGYTILEKIGGGGKGVVYKAIKDDTGAEAAVKMMLLSRSKRKKQRLLETFWREIQITKQLDHPNIVRYLGDGVSGGAPYLALEYVEGGTLDELIRRSADGRMDLPQAVPLFIQLLEAAAHMHGRFLVHRDIKPKNVLLDLRRGGTYAAKLSDMGLTCRFTDLDAGEYLPIVTEGGTPAYMPPEQLTDLTRAIPQSDVFSAAATLYHMLTGELLYDFAGRDQTEAIIESNIRPIAELRPELPSAVAGVIDKALSYTPGNRYEDASEMLFAFKAALA